MPAPGQILGYRLREGCGSEPFPQTANPRELFSPSTPASHSPNSKRRCKKVSPSSIHTPSQVP
jgi:hypothetical protein